MLFAPVAESKERYSICKNCEHFSHTTKLCGMCGCFMPAKVILPNASCPIQKWGNESDVDEEQTS